MIELFIYIQIIYFCNLSIIYTSCLFYKMLPKYGLILLKESSNHLGENEAKTTCNTSVVVCTNTTCCHKLPLVLIRKYNRQECFENQTCQSDLLFMGNSPGHFGEFQSENVVRLAKA